MKIKIVLYRINVVLLTMIALLGFSSSMAIIVKSQYSINVKFDPIQHALIGYQTVRFTNNTQRNLSHIYFVLLANHSKEENPYLHPIQNDRLYWDGWEPTATNIEYVSDLEGRPVSYALEKVPSIFQTFSLNDVLLRVNTKKPLRPGQSIDLKMGFTTFFAHNKFGDQAYWQSVYTWRFAWNPIERAMVNEQWDTQGFRLVPAYYKVTVEVPSDFSVAAGADIRKLLHYDNKTTSYYFESKIPQLSIPIIISRKLKTYQFKTEKVNIESLYYGDYEDVARMLSTHASDIITYFEKSYGNYPYQNLIISDVSAPFTSMAADGMVLMSREFYKYKDMLIPGLFDRLVVYVLAHEIAHLWWGVGITSDFAGESWLSEAFANYLAYSYIEHKYGAERNFYNYKYSDLFTKLLKYIIGETSFLQRSEESYLNTYYAGWDEEIVKPPSEVKFDNVSGARIYEKGYWVLRALENQLGKDEMTSVLKTTYDKYHSKHVTVKQFQEVCEQVSGESLEWFFKQWLYGSSFLDYSIQKVKSSKRHERFETEIVVGKEGKNRAETSIRIITKNKESVLSGIRVDGESDIFTVQTQDKVTKVVIDPDKLLPDVYRINNTWPRQIKTRFGLNNNPLDAYSIRYYILPSFIDISASGRVASGMGFGIGGGYSPTHQWLLNMSVAREYENTYLLAIANFRFAP